MEHKTFCHFKVRNLYVHPDGKRFKRSEDTGENPPYDVSVFAVKLNDANHIRLHKPDGFLLLSERVKPSLPGKLYPVNLFAAAMGAERPRRKKCFLAGHAAGGHKFSL